MVTLACIRNMLFIANNNNKIMRPKPIVPSLKFPVPQTVEPKPGKIPVTQPQTIGLRPPEGPLPGGSSPDLSSGSPEPANGDNTIKRTSPKISEKSSL